MSEATIIFFLTICVGILVCVILYQQFAFRTGTQAKLRAISDKLKEIIEKDSDEQITVFTENKDLMELAAQINALLEKCRKASASDSPWSSILRHASCCLFIFLFLF